MEPLAYTWAEMAQDNPVPFLWRKKVEGANMLVARVELAKGCVVAVHSHVSEQIAIIVSGHVRWTLGQEGTGERREVEMKAGQVLRLPSNFPHGLVALEDSLIFDVLSPPGAMGVDSQGRE